MSEVRGRQRPRVPGCDNTGRVRRATQVRGQGRWLRGDTPRTRTGAVARRSYPTPPHPRPGAAVGRSYPTPEARGSGREDQPHVQGAVAARAQEGLEELSHIEGQEGLR